MNVEGRTYIRFHWGCKDDDTLGCILVAEEFGVILGETAILQSRTDPNKGFNEFLKILEGIDRFQLGIVWCDRLL